MGTTELREKIDALNEGLKDFGQQPLMDLWQLKKDIFDLFKVVDFADREERQAFWTDFQSLVDTLDLKHKKLQQEQEAFAEEAEAKLAAFETEATALLQKDETTRDDFQNHRQITENLFEFIRQSRWPSKERRTSTWDKFTALRDAVRDKENVFYAQLKEAIAQRTEKSAQLTAPVLHLLEACSPATVVDDTLSHAKQLVELFAQEQIALEGFDWLANITEEAKRQSLKIKSDTIRDLRKNLLTHREIFTREDRQQLFDKLDEVQDALGKAWDEYKADQKRRQAEWEERRKQNEIKRQEWEQKQRNFLAVIENKLKLKIEYRDKLQNGPSDQIIHIEKIENRISNQQDFLLKLQDQLLDLEEKHETAWSKPFKEKSLGWIEEKKAKIDSVEKDIADLTRRVESIRKSSSDLPKKLEELNLEITDLQTKISEVKANLKLERQSASASIPEAKDAPEKGLNEPENTTASMAAETITPAEQPSSDTENQEAVS